MQLIFGRCEDDDACHPILTQFLFLLRETPRLMEPPLKKRKITKESYDSPYFHLPTEILDLIYSNVSTTSLLIIRALNKFSRDWSNRRIETLLRRRFGLSYSGSLLAINGSINFMKLFVDYIWKIEERVDKCQYEYYISLLDDDIPRNKIDDMGALLHNIPASYLQWCYSMTHWRDRRYVVRLAGLDMESLLDRTVFIDCFKSWKYVEGSTAASDGWIKLIIFGADPSGKMATIYYHYSVTTRKDIIGDSDHKVKFLFFAELGFITDTPNNSNNISMEPLKYYAWNYVNGDEENEEIDALVEQNRIEQTVHESYIHENMSFYVSKSDSDMRALMDWIGCPNEISTRQFYQYLQAITVKYRLSNHETKWYINTPPESNRKKVENYSRIYNKIVRWHLQHEKVLFGSHLKEALRQNKLFKDITVQRKFELNSLYELFDVQVSLVAPSNPSDQQTKSFYKTVRLSLLKTQQFQPITIVARMQIEWKKNQLRFALTFQLVRSGWNEPSETDWNNLSSTITGISSDMTFLFVQRTQFDFHERLAFDWSANYTETITCKEKGWKFLSKKLNCQYLLAEDLADMFIALFGLQTCLVRVFTNQNNRRSYQLDLRVLSQQYLSNFEAQPSWPQEILNRRQVHYGSNFEREDCSLESSKEDESNTEDIDDDAMDDVIEQQEQQSNRCIIQ